MDLYFVLILLATLIVLIKFLLPFTFEKVQEIYEFLPHEWQNDPLTGVLVSKDYVKEDGETAFSFVNLYNDKEGFVIVKKR